METGLHPLLQRNDEVQEVESLMKRLVLSDQSYKINEIMNGHLVAGGKRFRARLALAAITALGSSRKNAVGWAAAIELLHNATLIHDDIQDQDEVRRGHPTVWSKYGINEAINAGDLMLMLPFSALQEVPEKTIDGVSLRWALSLEIARVAQTLVRGQSQEQYLLRVCGGPEGEQAYIDCANQKTGALLSAAIYGAALISGCPEVLARALAVEFEPVGLIFQIQDDILDLFGDKGRAQPGQDLQEGKVSLLVVEHMRLYPEDGEWLAEKLSRPRGSLGPEEVEELIETFREGGALKASLDKLEMQVKRVEESKNLLRFPNLYFLATESVETILEPIKHVRVSRAHTHAN
ncbi:MAG: polyprenyl synthetase family protein [Bdellovibrionia bacterium]